MLFIGLLLCFLLLGSITIIQIDIMRQLRSEHVSCDGQKKDFKKPDGKQPLNSYNVKDSWDFCNKDSIK